MYLRRYRNREKQIRHLWHKIFRDKVIPVLMLHLQHLVSTLLLKFVPLLWRRYSFLGCCRCGTLISDLPPCTFCHGYLADFIPRSWTWLWVCRGRGQVGSVVSILATHYDHWGTFESYPSWREKGGSHPRSFKWRSLGESKGWSLGIGFFRTAFQVVLMFFETPELVHLERAPYSQMG